MSALIALVGCGQPEAAPAPTPAPVARPEVAAPREVAAAAAFALVPTGEGAFLAWGVPAAQGGGLRSLALGPLGQVLEAERSVVASGSADEGVTAEVELEAAAVGRQVGLAYVTDRGAIPHAMALYSADGGRRFSQPEDLGATVALAQRGRLAMAASSEGVLSVQYRPPPGPCRASAGTCALIHRHGIGPQAARAVRGDEPLEVLHPCEPLISSVRYREGTWYYSVCHADPIPSATVYAIRPALSYAAAHEIEGCGAASIAPIQDGVLAVARCSSGLVATRLDEMGRASARMDGVQLAARCSGGRPVLTARSSDSQVSLQLADSLDHLEALLPRDIAPEGARAIWTGEALLVASAVRGTLSLRRYQCSADRLIRTDDP